MRWWRRTSHRPHRRRTYPNSPTWISSAQPITCAWVRPAAASAVWSPPFPSLLRRRVCLLVQRAWHLRMAAQPPDQTGHAAGAIRHAKRLGHPGTNLGRRAEPASRDSVRDLLVLLNR